MTDPEKILIALAKALEGFRNHEAREHKASGRLPIALIEDA
jgi:hypothetical protein